MTDFRFQSLGQMTPKVKIFENFFPDSATKHLTTFRDQIWWKSAVAKLPKGPLDYHTKKLGSSGLVPAPILPKMGRSRPKFPESCHSLTCLRIPNLVGSAALFRTYFGKIDFSAPKVITIGFLPTIINGSGPVFWDTLYIYIRMMIFYNRGVHVSDFPLKLDKNYVRLLMYNAVFQKLCSLL